MILAHQVETPEEQAEVQQEFYPEGVVLEEEAVPEGASVALGSIFGPPSDPDQEVVLVPPGYEGFGAPSAAEPQIKGLF